VIESNSLREHMSSNYFSVFTFQGSYAGNAIGFKIASLTKLMDTQANKPRLTLLHYLVEEAEKQDKDIFKFTQDLAEPLASASR